MTREEIIEKAKYIIVPNFCELRGTLDIPKQFRDFMATHEGIELHGTREDLCKAHFNEHHFTNHWIYENTLPAAFSLLDVKFNPLDYYKVTNVCRDSNGTLNDFSYLAPYDNGSFEVSCNLFTLYENTTEAFYLSGNFIDKGGFSILVPTKMEDIPNRQFYYDALFFETTEYHCLYRCPHQCSLIKNNGSNNGKSLLINSDSHSLPIIALLANYYKEVVILDNRLTFSQSYLFRDRYFDDVLFVMSPINELKKYIETNLQ